MLRTLLRERGIDICHELVRYWVDRFGTYFADNIPAAIESVAAEFGGIDFVVNNAEIAGFLAIDDPDYDAHWGRMISINLTAQQRIVRTARDLQGCFAN